MEYGNDIAFRVIWTPDYHKMPFVMPVDGIEEAAEVMRTLKMYDKYMHKNGIICCAGLTGYTEMKKNGRWVPFEASVKGVSYEDPIGYMDAIGR